MSDFVLYHHLGMGDHIMMNGLVRHIYAREQAERFWLICFERNGPNVIRMFDDLTNLIPLYIQDGPNSGLNALINSKGGKVERLELDPEEMDRYYNGAGDDLFFDKYGYDRSLLYKFKCAHIAAQRWKDITVDTFVHDEGYPIPVEGFRPMRGVPICDHLPLMHQAREIHVISSAFLCLCIVHPELAAKTTAHLNVRNPGLRKFVESKGIKVV